MLTYFKDLPRLSGRTIVASLILLIIPAVNIYAQSLHTTYADLPCLNKTFNAMVYVSANAAGETEFSVENIEAAFAEANRVFSPICISFRVAKVDTILNYSYNDLVALQRASEAVNLFSLGNRLNIYFVSDLSTYSTVGFTEGSILSDAPNGLFVRKGHIPSLFHQLGLFFGLLPTQGENSGDELVNGSNCEETGDLICDTPADPFFVNPDNSAPIFIEECEFIYNVRDPNGEFYQPDVGNAMSYYGCPCTGFTRGQFLKMVENYNNAAINLW